MEHLTRGLTVRLLSLGLLGLLGCNPSDKGGDAAQKQGSAQGFKAPPEEAGDPGAYLPIAEPVSPAAVGFGMDINNQRALPNICVEGETIDVPKQEGFISLDADYSRQEVESFLGVNASGSVNFLFWGASARGNFAHKARMTGHSINYVLFAFNKHHSKVFMPKKRAEHMLNVSQDEWLQSCGAGYVAAQDFGSMLIVKFSLLLEDSKDKKEWGAAASGNYLSFAKMRASISGNNRLDKKRGVLSLSAIQIGGKPEELGKILKTSSDKGVIESFALCNVDQVETCLEGLRAVETYVSEDFPKQIQDEKAGGGAIVTTYPFRYPKTIGHEFNPGVDHFVMKARTELTKMYDAEMDDISKLSSYADKDDEEAQEILGQAQQNVAEIRRTTELCYATATYKQCTDRWEELAAAVAKTVVPDSLGVGESGEGNSGSSSGE